MKKWKQQAKLWPIDKILPFEHNVKLHNVEWIINTISIGLPENITPEARQQYIIDKLIDQPIVVDGDGRIIKGHGRRKAAVQLGLTEFPVIVRTDLSPEQVRLARLADNRSAEGGYDAEKLTQEINALMDALPEMDFESLGMPVEWLHAISVTMPSDIDIDSLFVDDTGPEREKQPEIITCPHCGEDFEP